MYIECGQWLSDPAFIVNQASPFIFFFIHAKKNQNKPEMSHTVLR